MDKVWLYLAIGLGSGLGGIGRFWLAAAVAGRFGGAFPWGTLVVNVLGSFVVGLFVALTGPDGRWLAGTRLSHFFTVGVCGGFTTFSTFSLQTFGLMRDGHFVHASANAGLSLLLCLGAVWFGHATGQFFNR